LPNNGVADRLAGRAIRDEDGLALMRDAAKSAGSQGGAAQRIAGI
jgi:hypothetical protein